MSDSSALPSINDPRRAREYWHQHAQAKEGWYLWFEAGSALLRAALKLIAPAYPADARQPRDIDSLHPGLLLRAFGVENLLKAGHLKRGGRFKENKAGNIPGCGSHDLLEMARKIGLILSSAEEEVLHVLKTCALHAGRYPIGRFPDQAIVHLPGHTDRRAAWSLGRERAFAGLASRVCKPLFADALVHGDPRKIDDVLDDWIGSWLCELRPEVDPHEET